MNQTNINKAEQLAISLAKLFVFVFDKHLQNKNLINKNMKTTITINGKPVEIELTPDQVAKIQKQSGKVTDRIKTFQDACNEVCITTSEMENLTSFIKDSTNECKAAVAHFKMMIICKALNEGWYPNWSNKNEYKYYPWFEYTPGGSFSFHGYDSVSTLSFVGSRLCFKSRELAEYAAKQFKDIYNQMFN